MEELCGLQGRLCKEINHNFGQIRLLHHRQLVNFSAHPLSFPKQIKLNKKKLPRQAGEASLPSLPSRPGIPCGPAGPDSPLHVQFPYAPAFSVPKYSENVPTVVLRGDLPCFGGRDRRESINATSCSLRWARSVCNGIE